MGVRSVRPQLGKNAEGLPDPNAVKDTIEVHASFHAAEAFFGLTSYLRYAGSQIAKSHEWIEQAKKRGAPDYDFPWKSIDDSYVEATGFVPQPFSFELDQAKILDLLTGHTLYNETSVVLRELVQNAIDAVRLQRLEDPSSSPPKVAIHWDTNKRILTVTDNGTGMTQEIIEKHLLKVGSSRYQDPEFIKQHPHFSPISRFGIGVLSCFMISDEVEVTTCSPDDTHARHIALRSVHGRYLVRLLDKATETESGICPHGTVVKVFLRPSAKAIDVLAAAKRWILIPACTVTVQYNSGSTVKIGYDSPKDALKDALVSFGYSIVDGPGTGEPLETKDHHRHARIIQQSEGGVTVAFAVSWSDYFREWTFVGLPEDRRSGRAEHPMWYVGTSVEGIRVEPGTPGFEGPGIAAVANTTGEGAPRTNVARSSIENTPERNAMLTSIYRAYVRHVVQELSDLHRTRGFSLSWATREVGFLTAALNNRRASNPTLLTNELMQVPGFLIERGGNREAVSAATLQGEATYWTVESALLRSAEQLIKEAPASASLSSVMAALHSDEVKVPEGVFLAWPTPNTGFLYEAFESREVIEIRAQVVQRRVDLKWGQASDPPRWVTFSHGDWQEIERSFPGLFERVRRGAAGRRSVDDLLIGTSGITISGLTNEHGIRAHGMTLLLPHTKLAVFLATQLKAIPTLSLEEVLDVAVMMSVAGTLTRHSFLPSEELIRDLVSQISSRHLERSWVADFVDACGNQPIRIFDPTAWQRGESGAQEMNMHF